MSLIAEIYVSEEVAAVQRLHQPVLTCGEICHMVRDQLFMLAENLHEQHKKGNPDVCVEIRNFPPAGLDPSNAAILQHPLSLEEARTVIAREHGFQDWEEVLGEGSKPFDRDFERAVDALITGDLPLLRNLIEEKPELLEQRSTYGHGAMLLHYCAANGVEIHRQSVPLNLPEITAFLLEKGANIEAVSFCYGGLYTVRALLESGTQHQAAGNFDEMLALLAQHGA